MIVPLRPTNVGGSRERKAFFASATFIYCSHVKFTDKQGIVESVFLIIEKLLWAEKVWGALTEYLSGGP
jgi:hypothetical protein